MNPPPHDMNQALDMVSTLRQQVMPVIAMLPPSQAKKMIEHLHQASGPLVDQVRDAYPLALDAFESQQQEIDTMTAQAHENLATAKQKAAAMPPLEQVRQNLVPPAVELPAGLSAKFAAEMQSRYAPPPPTPVPPVNQPGTAWQDWTLT